MNIFTDKFFVPMSCPCCGERIFAVCDKDGEVIDVIQNDIFKEYLDEKTVKEKDS